MVYGVQRGPHGSLVYPSTALVLMATGVRASWRQALCFFILETSMPAERLVGVVKKSISKLRVCGPKTVNFTCDLGGNFSALLPLLGASEESPFFYMMG